MCARDGSPLRSFVGITALLSAAVVAGCGADARDQSTAEASYVETIPGTEVRFDMVWIEAGGFWIGRHEVTWDEYLLFCDFDGVRPVGADAVSRPSKPLDDVTPFHRNWGLGRRPALGVSWNAAKTYCKWLSQKCGKTYRLPTEAEWQLACGRAAGAAGAAGAANADEAAGADEAPLDELAWYGKNSDDMSHEVGQKKPNAHGLCDMLGNVWEYCRDPVSADEPERAVLRGGSWMDQATHVTPQSRLSFDDDWVLDDPNVPPGVWWVPDGEHLGFRVLRARADAGR